MIVQFDLLTSQLWILLRKRRCRRTRAAVTWLPASDIRSQLKFPGTLPIQAARSSMKCRFLLLAGLLLFLGCGTTSTPGNSPRAYSATASVGDFLSITLDPVAHTLAYTNVSNGDSGTIPYAVNSDGTYALQDPQGVLVAAYEVPNFGMIVQAAKAGPNHDMPALITAVAKGGSISPTTWANQKFNYMQFRTAAGGMEVGSASMDAQGNVTISHYWPYGNSSGQSAFGGGSFSATDFVPDPSGAFMTMSSGGSSPDYVFGTPSRVFAVDTSNGAIIGLKKASSKNFDEAVAGSYKAIYYQKTGAATGQGNVETGTPSLGNATITIGENAQITVQNSQGNTLVQTTLTPVADASYLYGAGELTDPCYGLFTFRVSTANSQQDVFVTFMDHTILFASFTGVLPANGGNPYDYLYGVGLK
jgi:hypothetical protein